MLSNEVMGALALAILWVNTLLIVAQRWQELRALRALAARMQALGGGALGLARGRVIRGRGGAGVLAVRRVEQVGRAADGARQVVVFSDRSAEGEVLGGVVKLEDGREVEVEPAPSAEVWIDGDALARAAACPSDEAFAALYEGARKARGAARTVEAAIEVDQEIFLFGHFRPKGAGLALEPAREGGLLIASLDPRRFIADKVRLLALFIGAAIAAAAGCTYLALYPPVFGLVSKIGGALSLVFFLVVQPAGVRVREAARTPSRARLHGSWAR